MFKLNYIYPSGVECYHNPTSVQLITEIGRGCPILKPSNQLLFIRERERFVLNFSHLDKSRWSLFLAFRLHFLLSGATGSNPETT